MLIVIHADMRALGYCNRGARSWFARHQLDWADFIHQGIEAEQLLATGDAMAEAVVAVAQSRVSGDTTNGDEHGRQQ
jgi:hypothetical protein